MELLARGPPPGIFGLQFQQHQRGLEGGIAAGGRPQPGGQGRLDFVELHVLHHGAGTGQRLVFRRQVFALVEQFFQVGGDAAVDDALQEVEEGLGAGQMTQAGVPTLAGLQFTNQHQQNGVLDEIRRVALPQQPLHGRRLGQSFHAPPGDGQQAVELRLGEGRHGGRHTGERFPERNRYLRCVVHIAICLAAF